MTESPHDVPVVGEDDPDRYVLTEQTRALDDLLDTLLNIGPEEAE
jgi:hypothetical protein